MQKRNFNKKDITNEIYKKLGFSKNFSSGFIDTFLESIISEVINAMPDVRKIVVCGGGRKNKFLLKRISKKVKYSIQLIDDFGIDGDFIESQAFAYLAIRSFLGLPISFPTTTGCKEPITGGEIIKNF